MIIIGIILGALILLAGIVIGYVFGTNAINVNNEEE